MNTWDYDDPYLTVLEKPEDAPQGAGDFHRAVLVEEAMAFLQAAPGMLFLDGTLGGGGHSERLLRAGARVIAIDRDGEAIAHATGKLADFGPAFRAFRGDYRDAGDILDRAGEAEIAGALLDIGVSSHQIDSPERGFSFQKDGPLDMRMDPSAPVTAADLVNDLEASELVRIFREYGDEPRSAHIAAHIVSTRVKRPIRTTLELAGLVAAAAPRHSAKHPATRVFQALRIAVNDELGSLEAGLEAIGARLASGARFAVITFHSLEDRIVKHRFRALSTEWLDRPEWPEPRKNPARIYRLLTPHPIDAGPEELAANPRARSAKLRVVQKI